MAKRAPTPRSLLLPYQDKLAYDESRWKFSLQARQTGKDFTSNYEIVLDCLKHETNRTKVDWLIAAPSERQSVESLGKSKEWCEVFKLAMADYKEEREGGSEALLKSATITFPGGSRIIAVPGKPDTVRGFSANLLLTEFAFFEQPDATWRAVLPSITNPLRGGVKKVRLVTTPNGIGNKAHDLWVKNYQVAGAKWSCHHVDIYEAVAQGLPVDPEEIREGLDDPDGWAQEYLLQFMDAASVLLPYELITACESADATAVQSPEFWQSRAEFPIDLGIDFARSKDLTVCWAMGTVSDNFQRTIEVLELAKMSTPDQVRLLRPRIQRARRVCLDYTGPGVGLGDLLVEEFGEWAPEKHLYGKIELLVATNNVLVEICSKTRIAFEKRRVAIPVDRNIREDLHSICRMATDTGKVTYRAPHSPNGHADRFQALARAIRAGSYDMTAMPVVLFGDTRRDQILADRRQRTIQA